MSRASEDLLAQLHGLIGSELLAMLRSDDPRERLAAVDRSLRFLKDNGITSTVAASPDLDRIKREIPTAEDLERLMRMTPD